MSHVHLLMLPSYNIKLLFTNPDGVFDGVQALMPGLLLFALVVIAIGCRYVVGHMFGQGHLFFSGGSPFSMNSDSQLPVLRGRESG